MFVTSLPWSPWLILKFVTSLLLVVYFIYYVITTRRLQAMLPPGPKGRWYIGQAEIFQMDNPCGKFLEWSKLYPGVYTLHMMGMNIVVVNNYETIMEVTIKKYATFANRPYVYRHREYVKHRTDLITSCTTPEWIALKKATIHAMKLYGDGLQHLEDITTDILEDVIENLKRKCEAPTDIYDDLHQGLAAIISTLVYGRRLSSEHLSSLVDIDRDTVKLTSPTSPGAELDLFPMLRFIPWLPGKRYLWNLRDRVWQWTADRINEQHTAGSHASGVYNVLKNRQAQTEAGARGGREGGGGGDWFPAESVEAVCVNLIVAGVVTTSTAIYSLILIFLHRPEIQAAAQQEVDAVLGSRRPSLADRERCHYIESMLLELLRYLSHSAITIPHESLEAATIGGYHIPKATQIWIDLFSLHHDPELWRDPWEFLPERFLDEQHHLLPPDHQLRKQLLPFSAGRRACIGETLAKNRIFLFVTTFLQRFNFTKVKDASPPDMDPRTFTFGLILTPQRFQVDLTVRE